MTQMVLVDGRTQNSNIIKVLNVSSLKGGNGEERKGRGDNLDRKYFVAEKQVPTDVARTRWVLG